MTSASRLGRLPSPPDPRDHPLSRYVPALAEVRRERPPVWTPHRRNLPVYNQVGPSCVGNSQALGATIDQRRDHRLTLVYDGEDLYDRAKAVDGIPNLDGTYPRVGLKLRLDEGILVRSTTSRFARAAGMIGELDRIAAFAALRSIDEIVSAVWLYGSAEIGSTWYVEWDHVPADGQLPPGASASGGHDYRVVGYDLRGARRPPSLLIQNSWSEAWGIRVAGTGGRAWLPVSLVDFGDFESWRTIDLFDD